MSGFKRFAAALVCGALVLTIPSGAWGQEKKDEPKPAPKPAPKPEPKPAPKPAELKPKDAPPADAAQDEMMKAMMAAGAPGPHHAFFKGMVGKWKTSNKMFMGPEPTITEGTAEFELIMDGRFLKQTYTSTLMGMPFVGNGLMGYDNMAKKHVGFWIDNMGTSMYTSAGDTCDAEHKHMTATMSYLDPMTGEPAKTKEVFKIVDANTFILSMSRVQPDGSEQPEMEITYTRAQAASR